MLGVDNLQIDVAMIVPLGRDGFLKSMIGLPRASQLNQRELGGKELREPEFLTLQHNYSV